MNFQWISRIRDLMRNDKAYFILLLAFGLIPGFFSSSLLFLYHPLLAKMADQKTLLFFFFGISIFTMAFALTPTTFIAIISGYYLGWVGLAGILVTYPLAALLGLGFGKLMNHWFTGRNFFDDNVLKSLAEKLAEKQFALLFFCRLSPFLPFAMTNVALSRLKLNLWKYIAGTMAGMLPRTLLFFIGGMQAADLMAFLKNPRSGEWQQILLPIFILISLAGLYLVMRNAIKQMKLTQDETN
jgi:uncharacterized membrane protein YdjX (TVP38/TMEM64 family)